MSEKTKPTVKCSLISLEHECAGSPVYVANVHRTSEHPRLGPDVPGTVTRTSRIVRIDFDHRIIETLNTYYEYK